MAKWAIFSQTGEFKDGKLDEIRSGCTDDSTFTEVEAFDSESDARYAWSDGYGLSSVEFGQVTKVTEFFLVKVLSDEDGDEVEWQIEDTSEISLSAWAEYRNDSTGEVVSVEEFGFTSYSDADKWLDRQYRLHDPEAWTELHSTIS